MLILIVDDNEISQDVLKKILEISGYDTVCASDGEEGLLLARQNRPDLIISDIMMPLSDGYQFCRNIRMDPVLKNTPFIFYSAAFTSPQDIDFAYDLGATRFIQKPQSPKKILELVEELLSSKAKTGDKSPFFESLMEPSFLKLHSQRVIQKLEEKVAELEQTRSFLETVLDSMAEGLIVISKNYAILDANYAACTLLKLSKEEIVGKNCYNLLHGLHKPCSAATAICPFPPVFEEARSTKTTYTHTIPSEGHILEVMASPIRDQSGNISSMVQLIRDVTERAKLEEEVNNRIKELEDFCDASVEKELRLIELEKYVAVLSKKQQSENKG